MPASEEKVGRALPDALELAVRVTPKDGGRDAIEGVTARITLRTPGVPQRAVQSLAGRHCTDQTAIIEGPGAILAARLDAICAARPVP